MSGTLRPVMSSMKRSVSTNASRRRRATFRPRVVLPLQLKPTRTRLSIGSDKRTEIGERLIEAVASELPSHGVCQHQRDHCLADHSRSGHHADVAALHVGNITLAG